MQVSQYPRIGLLTEWCLRAYWILFRLRLLAIIFLSELLIVANDFSGVIVKVVHVYVVVQCFGGGCEPPKVALLLKDPHGPRLTNSIKIVSLYTAYIARALPQAYRRLRLNGSFEVSNLWAFFRSTLRLVG